MVILSLKIKTPKLLFMHCVSLQKNKLYTICMRCTIHMAQYGTIENGEVIEDNVEDIIDRFFYLEVEEDKNY